ncbi:MAG: DUF4111 domain-containing protein [Lachnospiraceae bacterium]|nr:DUF4111 domain-containing protein [Lachnospiraceae bacterium]
MNLSQYDDVNYIVDALIDGHKQIFESRMSGFYLYGSLVWGDFDVLCSDIDTLCVITSEITLEEIDKLRIMHEKIATEKPAWRDRVEVHYASLNGLKNFRKSSFKMGNISPGEPLHIIDAGPEWIDEWYCVQEYAITLFGIDKADVIPHIEKYEFIQTICGYACSFRERIRDSKNSCYSQAYAILTLCRALYTVINGEQVSKIAAARWVMEKFPEYSSVINDALIWRHERNSSSRNSYETYILAEKFVHDILDRFFDSEQECNHEV